MKKVICFSVVLSVVILLAGCSNDNGESVPAQLTAHNWKCYGFGNIAKGTLTPIVPDASYYHLKYETDGTFSATSFANSGSGKYSTDGNSMHMSDYLHTQVYAPNTDDEKFEELIGLKIESFAVTDSELRLFYNNGQEFLLFGIDGGKEPATMGNLTVNGDASLGVKTLAGRWKLVYDPSMSIKEQAVGNCYAQFLEDGTFIYEENVGEENESFRKDQWTACNDWYYQDDSQTTMTGRIQCPITVQKQYWACTVRNDSLFVYTASCSDASYRFLEGSGWGFVKVK